MPKRKPIECVGEQDWRRTRGAREDGGSRPRELAGGLSRRARSEEFVFPRIGREVFGGQRAGPDIPSLNVRETEL